MLIGQTEELIVSPFVCLLAMPFLVISNPQYSRYILKATLDPGLDRKRRRRAACLRLRRMEKGDRVVDSVCSCRRGQRVEKKMRIMGGI